MITASQILCHLIGDFILQSDWQAANKYDKFWVALLHGFLYTLPFLFLTQSIIALLLIMITHSLIDHYQVAKYICWVKNFIAPYWKEVEVEILEYNTKPYRIKKQVRINPLFETCKVNGYHPDRPVWLTTWLMIIVDNTMHLICNGAAIYFFN